MSLRFEAGGGVPPQSHEVLRIEPEGDGRYLTGMPWPAQPPFDEIGVYGGAGEDPERLRELAQAVLAAPPARAGHADAGGESIELDGATASWGPRERARRAGARRRGARGDHRRARPAPRGGACRAGGDRRARAAQPWRARARSRRRRAPPRLGRRRPRRRPRSGSPGRTRRRSRCRARLAPGATVELALPDGAARRGGGLRDALRAGQPRWRPEVPGEPDELDGWMISGPLVDSGRSRRGPFVIGSEGGERRRQETGGQPCGTCCSSTPTRASTAV